MDYLDDWVRLYGCLIERHNLQGIHCFSRNSFEAQMQTPGFLMTRAEYERRSIGMFLWYSWRDRAYSHLLAMDQDGYRLRASYALYWESIRYFTDKMRWLNLGGAAGSDDSNNDGLAMFKRRWASETRTAYLCGRIPQPKIYDQLTLKNGLSGNTYFPAYRCSQRDRD